MRDRETSPLKKLELQTVDQTDFGAYVRFLAQEGITILQSTEDLSEAPIIRARRMKLLIGFMTARVLSNREKVGLVNRFDHLWADPGIKCWVQEFVVDEEVKILMGQGIVQGFEATGLLPRGWQEFMPGSEIR